MIDRDHLREQTGGDVALQGEILGLFAAQMHALDDRLTAALANVADPGCPPDLAPALHRFRGAALAVGAGPLAGGLQEAEIASSGGSLDEPAIRSLKQLVAATLREIDG